MPRSAIPLGMWEPIESTAVNLGASLESSMLHCPGLQNPTECRVELSILWECFKRFPGDESSIRLAATKRAIKSLDWAQMKYRYGSFVSNITNTSKCKRLRMRGRVSFREKPSSNAYKSSHRELAPIARPN